MGKCSIDHSYGDVVNKLENQAEYLPDSLVQDIYKYLQRNLAQETLNELFHLLKKYDLASDEEKVERKAGLEHLIIQK
ncbi:MAG: hypothetical protein WBV93_07645 [Anaerobacillus sp.]